MNKNERTSHEWWHFWSLLRCFVTVPPHKHDMYRPHFLANLRAFYAQTFFGHCYVRSPVYVYLCVVYLSLQVLDFPFHLILVFQTARFNCVQRQIYAFVFNVPFIFLIALDYANSEDNCAYQYNFEGYEGLRIFAFE